ncbi:HNH endonuclease [Ensifer sp. 2YAB10]|uniref:HNH endonuclease n=1 Tax=unclassified Ensifer TaxID=2633371 RepID=UPI003F91FED7
MPVDRRLYDKRWTKLSRSFLRANRHCVRCGEPSAHADHIVPVKVAPHRRYDRSNLQALCQPCHSRITTAYEKGSLAGACDEDGVSLDPWHPWAQEDNAAAIKVANLPKDKRTVSPAYAAALKAKVSRQ